ncbi:MAG: hypothetical protein JSV65_09705 [Armatimonadota bacterium]|nr:MAG: hypothetical protein JSV65_09705 [Armatimonadota bacterium]
MLGRLFSEPKTTSRRLSLLVIPLTMAWAFHSGLAPNATNCFTPSGVAITDVVGMSVVRSGGW